MSDRMTEEEKEIAYRQNCPKCGTPWSKTQKSIGGFWWHCKPCGKKAEDLNNKEAKDKQLDMFEDALDDIDWDDWTTFLKSGTPKAQLADMLIQSGAVRSKSQYLDLVRSSLKDVTMAGRIEYVQDLLKEGAISTPEEYLELIDTEHITIIDRDHES